MPVLADNVDSESCDRVSSEQERGTTGMRAYPLWCTRVVTAAGHGQTGYLTWPQITFNGPAWRLRGGVARSAYPCKDEAT